MYSINGVTQSIPETEIIKNEYDKLGQLKTKKLGKKKDATGNYGLDALETVDYDYNIRGWLLGANRAFARDVTVLITLALTLAMTRSIIT